MKSKIKKQSIKMKLYTNKSNKIRNDRSTTSTLLA